MIVTTLKDTVRIESLHPLFKKLFEYVKSHDLLHTEPGRITIDGDNLFINNSEPTCVSQDEQVLEAHRKYIDVHILLSGKERIGWLPLEDCHKCTQPYDEKGDCALYGDKPSTYVDLVPSQVCIVWPEDPHAPIIGEGKIRKLIAKVKI